MSNDNVREKKFGRPCAKGSPETHTCHDCGYLWTHGQHGGHNCIGRLRIQRDALLEACVNLENDDGSIPASAWNLIQSAVAAAGGTPKEIPEETMREGYALRLRMREMDALARNLRDELSAALGLLNRAGCESGTTWEPGQSWIFWEDKCNAKNEVERIRGTLIKAQELLP